MSASNPSQETDQGERLKLPGFGLPVDQEPLDNLSQCFMHALWSFKRFKAECVYLREHRMMDFMNQVTDKPRWEEKVFDDAILARWKNEADSVKPEDLDGDVFFSEKMFQYCVEELREKAETFKKTGIINVLDSELVIAKSDTIVPPSLMEALKAGVKVLEDVPESSKDWHPGSNRVVLDLVHPSLYPLDHGVTRVLPYGRVPLQNCASFIGKGETTEPFKLSADDEPAAVWGSTQWLPSDLEWTETGLKIASYINNLHPSDHSDLYGVLEQFATLAVPLWEECLFRNSVIKPRIDDFPGGNDDFYLPEGVEYDIPDEYYETDSETGERVVEGNDYEWDSEYRDWFDEHKILSWPEPRPYSSRARDSDSKPNLRDEYPSGLQVIFKLANIHLTPERPNYVGGSLHIEGALNDRIVATALYYYDMENITESRLEFHQYMDAQEFGMGLPQGEWESAARWLGVDNDSSPFGPLGIVTSKIGRLLAFPNVFQHQVQPFELEYPLKPGHRKILAMFLVDPSIRILSTGVVPPQRKDWWAREIRNITPFSEIPIEVFDIIMDFVDGFPMSWEQALATREKLMAERTWASDEFETRGESYGGFNFCEH
ncbi:uncharacterized protein F4822DRAFT_43229 [Hypoxylon trugodes]|uniref:uncharacterized protein n=1 Tax=Hypoxylon trugodes TaxID=326681 RepID=UPI0021957037|nr:uncharacterized protein F4822DRAFT_43229 [Hypoxylon trugodes]KAI1394262.1 hypothetical protein F4822DRAFT_43229 [Hypoxylon trugodes]